MAKRKSSRKIKKSKTTTKRTDKHFIGKLKMFLDTHYKVKGLTAKKLKEAHKKDLAVQKEFGVKYIKYWFDRSTGRVYCLVKAPSKKAANAVHKKAHGALADEISEVEEGS
jgi:hypothetical protein